MKEHTFTARPYNLFTRTIPDNVVISWYILLSHNSETIEHLSWVNISILSYKSERQGFLCWHGMGPIGKWDSDVPDV